MKEHTEKAAEWVYRGVWSVLSGWFRVPEHPPSFPVADGEELLRFHPSRRYLAYLKLFFWLGLIAFDLTLLLGWLALFASNPPLGVALALPAFLVAVVPGIVAYIAIHLRYDTMWYVMSERSLRCRRGIWILLEHTITFENVQNVHVKRGPVQYFFGISTIVIETAGSSEPEGKNEFAVGNKAILEGIDNPVEIRERILERVRRSKGAGLGDEANGSVEPSTTWSTHHVRALREILGEVRRPVR